MTDTAELLQGYTSHGSEKAFAEIVHHYIDLVYSTALRKVNGDTYLAEDVAQMVFTDLARKAKSFPTDVVLGGWLHHHTCFLAANVVRSERRRQTREQKAAEMDATPPPTDDCWNDLAPLLDDALERLSAVDRDAIVLRFFEDKSLGEVARVLSMTEDAAQKRVSRAVERLREFFTKRGVTVGASGLAVVISANAVQAAPAGLAATVSSAAVLAGTTIATTATITKAIAMTTLQKTLITATIVAAVGTGIYEARQNSRLREQNQALLQLQAPLTNQIRRLQEERDEAANRLSALAGEREPVEGDSGELLKLRAEAARLREEADTAAVELKQAKDFQSRVMQIYSNTPPTRTFVSTTSTTVSWDQAIVTGGWKTPSGKRAILLLSLQPGADPRLLTMESTVLEYTDVAGNVVGLSQYNTDEQSTMKAHKLNSDQAEAILQAPRDHPGISVVSAPIIQTGSGQQARIQVGDTHQTSSGEKYSAGTIIDLIPTIAADGQSVQLVIAAQLNYPIPLPELQTH